MDYVYLKAEDPPPSYDTLPKATVAPDMIDLIEDGAPAGYSGFEEGDRLSKFHVVAIMCADTNYDPDDMAELYDEIEAEKALLTAIHPCEYSVYGDFVSALEAVNQYITVSTWVDKLKIYYDVETWSEMISWCEANYTNYTQE